MPRLWKTIMAAARARSAQPVGPLPIYGADLYGEQLKLARANLAAAGLADVGHAQAGQRARAAVRRRSSGVLVTNPPYGVRLGEQQDLAAFYPKLGDALKAKYAGWNAWMFTARSCACRS